MRDSTKAITGSKQIFEPVVKGALHTCVTRNPMNKQITYKHCKSPQLRRSSEAICSCKKHLESRRDSGPSHLSLSQFEGQIGTGKNEAHCGLNACRGYRSALSLTTGQHHGKTKPHKPCLECQGSKKYPNLVPPLDQASWYWALHNVDLSFSKLPSSKNKNQVCWHKGSELPNTKSPPCAERKCQGFRQKPIFTV